MTDQTAATGRNLLGRWFGMVLWKRILIALVLGAVVGLVWGEGAESIKWIGDLFVRLIRMMVVPLVFISIAAGVAALIDPKRLGSIGVKTIGLYLFTTFIAAGVGLTIGAVVQPGLGADFAGAVPQAVDASKDVSMNFLEIVPLNPIGALAEGDLLAVIFFAIFLGAGVLAAGERAKSISDGLQVLSEIMLKMVGFVMELAPFGVFALIAAVMGTHGLDTFTSVFVLAMCVLGGCLFQSLVVHGLVVRLLAWLPVWPFFRDIGDAVMVAFSTSSSSATLPVAMRVAEKNLGVSPVIASTALPIGTTVSMDGTALYIGLLATFTAQAFGYDLSLMQYVVIAVTTVMVAVGTAPVPSASLFMLAGVLTTFGGDGGADGPDRRLHPAVRPHPRHDPYGAEQHLRPGGGDDGGALGRRA